MWSNLQLLGFGGTGGGAPAPGPPPPAAGPRMFRQSNNRAAEAAVHFLLDQLDSELLRRQLAGLWPIYDSRQAREFRKVALAWLQELEHKGALPKDAKRQATLAAAQGERMAELVWRVSMHVLEKKAGAQLAPPRTAAAEPEDIDAAVRCCRARCAAERAAFARAAREADARQRGWQEAAAALTAEFRELSAERAGQRRGATDEPASEDDVDAQLRNVERVQAVAAASAEWEAVMQAADAARALATPLDAVLDSAQHPHRVDAAELGAAEGTEAAELAHGWGQRLRLLVQHVQPLFTALTPRPREDEDAPGPLSAARVAALRLAAEQQVSNAARMRSLVSDLRATAARLEAENAELRGRVEAAGGGGSGYGEAEPATPAPRQPAEPHPFPSPRTPAAYSADADDLLELERAILASARRGVGSTPARRPPLDTPVASPLAPRAWPTAAS